MKQSYEEYRFSMTEILKYLVQGLLLCGAVDYLFYQNPWLMFLALPVTVFFLKWKKKGLIRERKKNLNYQFKDALNALSVAVQAGYSVENAVMACSRDLERLYPQETDIVREFHYMETQLKVSVPVEELFMSFGDRSGIEDIENFAAVFYTAKRTGGDMNRIIQTSSRMLGDKIDVRREIETTLAAKKAEQMIMSLMPAGIILYLKLTSPGFLQCMLDGTAIDTDWCKGFSDGADKITPLNEKVVAEGTDEKVKEVEDALADGSLHVFDTSTFTVDGKELTTYKKDGSDTEYISDGYFHESEYGSAPAFDIAIDGITSITE